MPEVLEKGLGADKGQSPGPQTDSASGEGWEKRTKMAKEGKGGNGKRKKHLTGSLAAKVAAFILFAASLIAGVGGVTLFAAMVDSGFYTKSLETLLEDAMWGPSRNAVEEIMGYLSRGDEEGALGFLQSHNIELEISHVDEDNVARVIWSTWKGYGTDTEIVNVMFRQFNDLPKNVTLNGHILDEGGDYIFHVYIDPELPIEDDFRIRGRLFYMLYDFRTYALWLGLGGILLGIICFVFLMSSAGHRNGYEGIVPGVLTGIHLDVLTVFFVGTAVVFARELGRYGRYPEVYVVAAGGIVLMVWMTIYFMELALRLKLGKCWRHTLVYRLLRIIWRVISFLGRGAAALVRGMPLVMTTLLVFFGICILDFLVLMIFRVYAGGFWMWLLIRAVMLGAVMYVGLTCKNLLGASRALAEGQENYKVDTSKMIGDFREHGENLNSLGEGISKAVAERMKSEHLKTELITNVSHDIKTPLTSIINYADLIYEESVKEAEGGDARAEGADSPMARINEYSQVLLRQSRRMKKLLEDLVEASKATTGNLEVNLEPCEAGVLLSQAVGEYQQKMEEKGLELIARQPEEQVRIMADGRHLWRVFDNLLNNICKYAQENTRVYLHLEKSGGRVRIIFRNMSKYPLDVSAEELEERFVRGDRSRHMEGNGLGLSISKSLVELQKGFMEIVIDGDLFKVILTFDEI